MRRPRGPACPYPLGYARARRPHAHTRMRAFGPARARPYAHTGRRPYARPPWVWHVGPEGREGGREEPARRADRTARPDRARHGRTNERPDGPIPARRSARKPARKGPWKARREAIPARWHIGPVWENKPPSGPNSANGPESVWRRPYSCRVPDRARPGSVPVPARPPRSCRVPVGFRPVPVPARFRPVRPVPARLAGNFFLAPAYPLRGFLRVRVRSMARG